MNGIVTNNAALAAVDDLGRTLPAFEEVGSLRKEKYVGMFYFLTLGSGHYKFYHEGLNGPINVTEILEKYPEAAKDPNHPAWGKEFDCHHWGESIFGYYGYDEWVMRRHVEMLALADIDFLVLDTTNLAIYPNTVLCIMKLVNEYTQKGYRVPKVAFYTNTCSGERAQTIYEMFYKQKIFPDSWFYLDGKPLLIGKKAECSAEVQAFFRIKESQWPNEPAKPDAFPWMEFVRPQRVFCNERGEKDVISVSPAQHPTAVMSDSVFLDAENWGRSYHHGRMEKAADAYKYGYNFQEQWDFALSEDPRIIFVTGWNEWLAYRYNYRWNENGGRVSSRVEADGGWKEMSQCDGFMLLDCATTEYSRDIEPMRGGFFDNYYMQLCQNVRRFKGTEAQPVSRESKTIRMDGDFSQWADVEIAHRGFVKDSLHRCARGYGINIYQNYTAVNNIHLLKAADDMENLYFYAECAADIKKTENYMMLYLDVGEKDVGVNGYSYRIRPDKTGESAWLEHYEGGAFRPQVTVQCRLAENKIMIALPKKAVGQTADKTELLFKWADSITCSDTVEDFYQNGDVAPYGRFGVRYKAEH